MWQVDHGDGITSLAFSPDGTRLASAAGTSTMYSTATREFNVAITDVRTGHGLLQFAAHSNSVISVAFTPDGTRLVTGSGDNTARVRTAFPWHTEPMLDKPTLSGKERLELYERERRQAGLHAAKQFTASSRLRTNVLDFIGEVNLPARRDLKTQPLLPVSVRDPRAGRQQIELSRLHNASLNETWQPVTGWDQVDLNLAAVPRGLQTLGGIKFDVRGLIQLHAAAPDWQWEWQTYPDQVRINIGQSFNWLHVLHATAYSEREGTAVGAYRLRYVDGSSHVLDIVYGRDLADWVGPAEAQLHAAGENRAVVAWTGRNPTQTSDGAPDRLRLFRRTYQNPFPDLEVDSIDFVSTSSRFGGHTWIEHARRHRFDREDLLHRFGKTLAQTRVPLPRGRSATNRLPWRGKGNWSRRRRATGLYQE